MEDVHGGDEYLCAFGTGGNTRRRRCSDYAIIDECAKDVDVNDIESDEMIVTILLLPVILLRIMRVEATVAK